MVAILRALLLFLFFAPLASAFAITGGGNFTNFSNVTGNSINILGAGYYYFVRSSTAATPAAGHINYTFDSLDAAISIESPNVVVDCQYPSLPKSIIAAALSPANTAAGVVVNATRTLNHLTNITIRNCVFTNYSRTGNTFDNAGIIVSGNVTGLTIYNNSFNDSAMGIMLTTNGSSNVAVGIFSEINVSTNTFYNITGGTGSAIEMRNHPLPNVHPNNVLSIRDSIIEYNNFTWMKCDGVANYSNATNLTVFGNLVYNSNNGFNFVNVNNSNFSNNNITGLFNGNTLYGFRIDNISQGDISSVPNLFANNWIYNTTAGFFGGGLRIEASYSNISRNTVIDSPYGIISSDLDRTDAFASHLIIADNYFQGINVSAVYIYNSTNDSILRNTIVSSFAGAPLTTVAGIAFLGSNGSVSIGNVMSNVDVGFSFDNSVNNTSQDDVLGNTNNMSIFLVNRANFSAVNLSANLSNISSSGLGPFNLTVQYPVSVSVVDLAGALLSSAAFSISANSALPTGGGGVVVSGTGSGSFNVTTLVAFLSSHTLTAYNYTPHSISATLAGYRDATGSTILPVGTSGSLYNYVITLTPNPHSSDSSSSVTPPVLEPVPPVNEPEAPATDSNPANPTDAQSGHSSNIVNDASANQSTASGQSNVGTQTGQISLNLPVVGQVQVDPLVAVAVGVVIVLIVFILMGMM